MAEWRTIPSAPGYEVSSDGRVRSPRGELRQMSTAYGHRFVDVCFVDRGKRRQMIHAVVLEVFVGPRPPGMEARHLDGVPHNNIVSNLAWGTSRENAADRDAHGTTARGERNGAARLTESQVREIRSLGNTVSRGMLAARFGVTHRAIRRILTGDTWRHLL